MRSPRPGTSIALLATAAVTLAGLVTAAPPASAISESGSAPKLANLVTSRSHLPSTGGHIRLHAKTANTKRCSLSVRPELPRLHAKKRCTGSQVSWRVRLPRNAKAVVARYRFTLKALGAHHAHAIRHRTVRVAAAGGAPAITAIKTSPATLEYVGGDLRVTTHLARALTCRIAVSPQVPGAPQHSACTGTKKTWTVSLPQNNSTAGSVTYQVGVTATGRHGRKATATKSVTVGPHPPPCPGQTSNARPRTMAYFNDPTTHSGTDQTAVVDAEINLICDAQLPVAGKPTVITLAAFIYQFDQVTQALLWAHQYMHADVRVLLDGTNEFITAPDGTVSANPAYNNLVAGLPDKSVLLCGPNAGTPPPPPQGGNEDEPTVFPAGTGCAGDNIMHTKLLTVSSVDAAHDPAVFSNSQNFSENAVIAALNNGLQVIGDRPLYDEQARYFFWVAADQQQPDLGGRFAEDPAETNNATTSSDFFPQNSPATFPPDDSKYQAANDNATDSVARLLNHVQCAAPGKRAGTHLGGTAHTKVRIAMFAFGNRPNVIAALESLQAAGCDLKIIYAEMTAKTLAAMQAHGIQTAQLDDEQYPYGDGSGSGRIFVHDKYLLISGGIKQSGQIVKDQNVVVTGSSNLTQNGLHYNDEANMTYQQTASASSTTPVYTAYAANWDHLAAIAASIPPPATGVDRSTRTTSR